MSSNFKFVLIQSIDSIWFDASTEATENAFATTLSAISGVLSGSEGSSDRTANPRLATASRTPDPTLADVTAVGFLEKLSVGEVKCRKRTDDAGAVDFHLLYESEGIPCALGFAFEKMFMSPPVLTFRMDGKRLMLTMDLRIELKSMLSKSDIPGFVEASSGDGFQGVRWSYLSPRNVDPRGRAHKLFEQPPSAFRIRFFSTKKALMEA